MDWNTVFWVGALVVLFFVMMRGCGGMMAGGCGMGSRRRQQRDEHDGTAGHQRGGNAGKAA